MPTKEAYNKDSGYYRKWGRQYYYRHRDEILKKRREKYKDPVYRLHHLEVQRRYMSQIRKTWNNGVTAPNRLRSEIGHKAEKFVAEVVLPKEGFTNIIGTSMNLVTHWNFPFFDILCEREGTKCGVAVTTSYFHVLRRRDALRKLLEFFSMKYFLCFLKPNYMQYHLAHFEIKKIPTAVLMTKKRMKNLKNIYAKY